MARAPWTRIGRRACPSRARRERGGDTSLEVSPSGSLGSLREGGLTLAPSRPATGALQLTLSRNDMDRLWLVIRWGRGPR